MGNITDDIRQHFDTFAALPFTEADSLALSQLAYARMPDNVPRYHEDSADASGMIPAVSIRDLLRAECYDDMFGKVWSPSMNIDLLRAMSESPVPIYGSSTQCVRTRLHRRTPHRIQAHRANIRP